MGTGSEPTPAYTEHSERAEISVSEANEDDFGEINAISVKAIELYQNQTMLVDRLWSYFSRYSGMLVILGLGIALFQEATEIKSLSWPFLLVPMLAYLVFAIGNHKTLALTMDELHMVRSIAITQTRLKFTSHGKGKVMGFHLVLILLCAGLYVMSCLYARGLM